MVNFSLLFRCNQVISEDVFSDVTAVHLTAEGMVAAGDSDGLVMLWDPRTREVLELGFHQTAVTALHSRGDLLASGEEGSTVRLWNTVHRVEVNSWAQEAAVSSVFVTPSNHNPSLQHGIFAGLKLEGGDSRLAKMWIGDTTSQVETKPLSRWSGSVLLAESSLDGLMSVGSFSNPNIFYRRVRMRTKVQEETRRGDEDVTETEMRRKEAQEESGEMYESERGAQGPPQGTAEVGGQGLEVGKVFAAENEVAIFMKKYSQTVRASFSCTSSNKRQVTLYL